MAPSLPVLGASNQPGAPHDDDGEPICENCRRLLRSTRPCGRCGRTAPIAQRADDGNPDICANCYRLPEALCSRCGRRRPCYGAAGPAPLCPPCTPRATAPCARCGHNRPPAVRWSEGPLCDSCYTAALRHRGRCQLCGEQRRLVSPPGQEATTCADCAGLPVTHACADCGTEDKLYEKNRCARCSLARRARHLLSGGTGIIPPQLTGVFAAICAAPTPRAALNWLRKGAGAAILAEIADGRLPATHQALDAHPRPRAANYLRQILIAHDVLPARDEELARMQRWLERLLGSITVGEHRRLIQAFAAWQVMRRLRHTAQAHGRPRTYTAHARLYLKAAADFLTWLDTRDRSLAECGQADVEDWLTTGSSASYVRNFLSWATEHQHCPALTVPTTPRATGAVTFHTTNPEQRWDLVHRLLHDDALPVVDRVAGLLVLLFGQQQSRIAAMTIDQIIHRDDTVHIRFGRHEIPAPEPLGRLLDQLITEGKSHVGVGSPTQSAWLFPGGLPGRPITPSRLADRLRDLGVSTMPGRRAALMDLATHLPPAILADLLGLHPTTAVRWTHQAGGDWSRYAAEVARTHQHPPSE